VGQKLYKEILNQSKIMGEERKKISALGREYPIERQYGVPKPNEVYLVETGTDEEKILLNIERRLRENIGLLEEIAENSVCVICPTEIGFEAVITDKYTSSIEDQKIYELDFWLKSEGKTAKQSLKEIGLEIKEMTEEQAKLKLLNIRKQKENKKRRFGI
jgi:hypothetical protein